MSLHHDIVTDRIGTRGIGGDPRGTGKIVLAVWLGLVVLVGGLLLVGAA